MRVQAVGGLTAVHGDIGVARCYDAVLLDTTGTRYRLLVAVMGGLSAISVVVVPLLERFLGGP